MTVRVRRLAWFLGVFLLAGAVSLATREVSVPGGSSQTFDPVAEGFPAAYTISVYRPDGSEAAARLCGVIPSWPPPDPWPHPLPDGCPLTVRLDRPGYWRVSLAAYYRHEYPAGACWASGDLLVVWVDEGPVFGDGFESGGTGSWSAVSPAVSPPAERLPLPVLYASLRSRLREAR